MSAFNVLFIVDVDGNFLINRPEAKKIKEFAVLFERDKGSEGDYTGSKKKIANAELFMIYLMYDVRSSLYNLKETERFDLAKERSGISSKWKVDKLWQDAIVAYKREFELTASGKGYAVAERAYHSFTNDTHMMQEEFNSCKGLFLDVLKRLKKTSIKGDEDVTLIATLGESVAIMNEMNKIQKDMMANIKMFSGLDNTVKELAVKFIAEGGQLKIKVGGQEVKNREN